jgi:hypothetical protein
MNKFQGLIKTINDNKKQIIVRTAVVAAGVIGVTLAAGLIKVVPTEKAAEVAETAAKAVKKAAE